MSFSFTFFEYFDKNLTTVHIAWHTKLQVQEQLWNLEATWQFVQLTQLFKIIISFRLILVEVNLPRILWALKNQVDEKPNKKTLALML